MTDTERYLYKVWYAKRDQKRLTQDLALAQSAYESAYENQCCKVNYDVAIKKQPSKRSPTEQAVILIVDEYKAQLDSIESELLLCRVIIKEANKTLDKAGLSCREEEYIRLRYFNKYSAEKVAKDLFCSYETSNMIRKRALEKIDTVIAIRYSPATA